MLGQRYFISFEFLNSFISMMFNGMEPSFQQFVVYFNQEQKLAGVKNSLRFLCGYGGSEYGHPSGPFRMNFLAAQTEIQKILCAGVEDKDRPQSIARDQYCFVTTEIK